MLYGKIYKIATFEKYSAFPKKFCSMCRSSSGFKITFFLMESNFFPRNWHKFLKFGEMEYLIHQVKFKMCLTLIHVNYPSYFQQ